MDFEPKTRSNYLTSEDFLVSCLFSGDYQNHNKPILQRIMKKLKTIDPIRLNCFKLFHNYKKSRELLTYIHIETDNSLDFHLKKLEKNMCLLVLRHLNYYKDKFKLKCNFGPSNQSKFEKGQLELSKYYVESLNKYPFLETKAKLKANMNNYYALGWLTKEYLFFSINLSFLLFGSLKWKKENKKFEALEEYCDFKWDFTQKMLDLIESMKILQIFSIIQQKSWNLSLFNSDSIEIEDFGLGLIFLLLFIKDLMLTKQNTIKSFNKLFLKDLIHYFRENKKFNDINNIFDYITKNHNGFLIKIEENSKNLEKQKGFIIKLQKVNLLNFLIFLLDYMNLHEFYLVFLKPYFKAQKIDTSIQLSILLTVLLITFEKPLKSEKKKKTQIFYEIFEEILLREKIFEKEVNGDISNEVSFILMALCAVLESNFNWEIDKVLEKIMDLYNFKLKLALGFIKKQYKNDQIYHIEFWEGSLLSDFILKFYKKNINLDNLTKKQDRDDGMIKYNGFSLYYKKTVKNLHILIGLTEKAVNLSFLDIFHDKTDPIKTKNAFVKKFNKLLYWNYYIFLKIMISENNDKFEKILFNFKLMKRFQKYEYNTKIIAFLENFAKDSKNIEILSKAHKNLIFFYLNQNNQMKGNLSEKIKFLAKFEFSDPTNVKENEEMGECYDRKCYLTFAESFLEFIKNNYGKKTEFLEMDERLKQKKNVLMQLHQKYSKAFDLSFNLFFEKGKWNVFK